MRSSRGSDSLGVAAAFTRAVAGMDSPPATTLAQPELDGGPGLCLRQVVTLTGQISRRGVADLSGQLGRRFDRFPCSFPLGCAGNRAWTTDFTLSRCGRFHVEGTLPVGINDAVRARLTRGSVLQLARNVKVGTWSEFLWLLTFEPLQHGSGNYDAARAGGVRVHGKLCSPGEFGERGMRAFLRIAPGHGLLRTFGLGNVNPLHLCSRAQYGFLSGSWLRCLLGLSRKDP